MYGRSGIPTISRWKRARKGRRAGVTRRVSPKAAFSPAQLRAIRRETLAVVSKGREVKHSYAQVDEQQVDPYLSSTVMYWSDLTTTRASNYCPIALVKGSNGDQRMANSVQPLSFKFDGLLKFTGGTDNLPFRSTLARVVFGYWTGSYDFDLSTIMTEDILLKGATTTVPIGDFNDLYLPFNRDKFSPFHDEIHELVPNQVQDVGGTASQTYMGSGKDFSFMRVRHSFGKNPKQQKYASATSAPPMDRILVGLIFCRVMTDDTVLGSINVEITGTADFTFRDS